MMFEYITTLDLTLSAICMVAIFIIDIKHKINTDDSENRRPYLLSVIGTVIAFLMPMQQGYSRFNEIKENTDAFKKERELECRSSMNNYLVSKERGWKLKKDIFIKNDLFIRADYCRIK